MKKNLVYMVAINHNKSSYEHSNFAQYSIKSWEYWCKKNDVDLHIVTEHKEEYGFPIWNKLDVCEVGKDYEKIAIVDCDTMVSWKAPNLFDTLEEGISGVRDISNLGWVNESITNYGNEFFKDDFEFLMTEYINAGVVFLDNKSLSVYEKLREFYFENKETLDNWNKGGGKEQTLFNFMIQKHNHKVNLLSPSWNLLSMHKTEIFGCNWQEYAPDPQIQPFQSLDQMFHQCKEHNIQPFFIKYGNIWHFTGFPIEWREYVMKDTWNLVGENYE